MFRVGLAALMIVVVTGCSHAVSSELAIYDWEAQRATPLAHGVHDLVCKPHACVDPSAEHVYLLGAPKLGGDDLDRTSVRAAVDPQTSEPILTAQFTARGAQKFEALTRKLAERGARLGVPQHLLISVDENVLSSPFVDYHAFPHGVDGNNGFQIGGLATLRETRDLAKALRRG
jgi:preprotein translocase subunit SecD